jgi:PAS domain S-box-containing protein
MRIDLDPATIVQPGPKTSAARNRRLPDSTTFVARRRDRVERDTPYDKLLESVYDGVFITDLRGVILDFNGRAAGFFKMQESHLLGLPLIDLVSGADERLIDTILANLDNSRYTLIEGRCRRSDGTSFPAEIAVNLVDLDGEGQLCFFVRDITMRRETMDALEVAVERLQAHDRARSEFVSNVSHELRTPLTSMIYAVGNMLRGVVGPLPDKAVRYLERLESDCRRLLGTVNDILDLRQIESGTLTLNKTRIPLSQIAQASVEAVSVQADAKHQKLQLDIQPRECFVQCDHQKLERVLINVIGNAIKFTPEEGEIVVRMQPDPADAAWVLLTVTDNGIGIPKDAIAKVTQRYFKVGDHPNGSGLGLSISREIVELHGGSLQINSPVPGMDRGTEVQLRLPLTPPPQILVVTDEACTGEGLLRMAEDRGYAAHWVRSGQEVLEYCASQQPLDLLALDLRLPDMDGLELVLHVRDDRRTQRLPVIVLTRDTLVRPKLDILQRLNIPAMPLPCRESDLLGRIAAAFGGRGVVPRTGG